MGAGRTFWFATGPPDAGTRCAQLLDTNAVGVRREKMYKLDDHVACAVAGITGATPRPGVPPGVQDTAQWHSHFSVPFGREHVGA